jgi:undecaprenyl-diphosphatase
MHTAIVWTAQYLVYLVILLGVAGLLTLPSPRRWQGFAVLGIAGVIALALMVVGSKIYSDPRPFVVEHIKPMFAHRADNGFPSDHTALTMVIAAAVWLYRKWLGMVLAVFSVLVGTARVLAHVHHTVDIGGAIVIALVAVAIAAWLTPQLLPHIPLAFLHDAPADVDEPASITHPLTR